MTFYPFSFCGIAAIGITLCVLFTLIITMLAKTVCQGKHASSLKSKKVEEYTSEDVFEENEPVMEGFPEASVVRFKGTPAYKTRFLINVGIPSRRGKAVNIRKEYHERMRIITQVIGNNKTTMTSYIDNILRDHFENHQNEIAELYQENKNHEDYYLTPKN